METLGNWSVLTSPIQSDFTVTATITRMALLKDVIGMEEK
jgi:hypothetical protein